ncbi:MAG: hypothetical protein UU66_C0008G0002 [Parcubacteria group bacterium GW2011_GWB1_41_5]|nr:MAG: hypothetical protein UU66_C0008G0002 [Parcubacteria group bacterium GW2011_GWB1_41_5]
MAVLFYSLIVFKFVSGYGDTTTHPGLTDEIVDFYNLSFDNKLTSEEKEWLIRGSVDEDTPPRWINHFYDPIYQQGWTGQYTGWLPEELMRVFSFTFLSTQKPVSSKNWANNQELQSKYKDYKGNRVWERAIYEYATGDKKEAFYSLGFILHLIEDLTVPDHTRNDTHAHDLQIVTGDYGSPYEEYTKRFTRENLNTAQDLKKANKSPVVLNSLDEYFENLANYSNNYFFSKDTINDGKYAKPKIVKREAEFGYGRDKDGSIFPLVIIDNIKIGNYETAEIFSIKNHEDYYPILDAYFSRLSREAVLNGAGIIDLFFKEAEAAKKNFELAKTPPKETSGLFSLFGSLSQLKNIVVEKVGSLLTGPNPQPALVKQSAQEAQTIEKEETEEEIAESALIESDELINESIKPEAGAVPVSAAPEMIPPESETPASPTSPITPAVSTLAASPAPGFGGGGSTAASDSSGSSAANESVQLQEQTEQESEPEADTVPPARPIILFPSLDFQISTTSTVVFSGTAEASSTVSQNFSSSTSPADSAGNWSLSLDLIQGTSSLNFYSTDSAGNISSSTSIELFVDSVVPIINDFYIAECLSDNLLSEPDNCLLATTTVHLVWSSPANDVDYYEFAYSSDSPTTATTTATSTTIVLSDNAVHTFSLKVKDKAGNWSEVLTRGTEISTRPVVINEIAWSGTYANPADEWIELYDNTSQEIDLNGWVLQSKDGSPYIKLAKTISPRGYYLLERTDDNTISDVAADQFFTGSLTDGGEILYLSKVMGEATTTIDQTIRANGTSGSWPAGTVTERRTMERVSPDEPGNLVSNWYTNNMVVKNGQDVNNNPIIPINGTPKARNSANYLITTGSALTSDKTLFRGKSPYLVSNTFMEIGEGVALTIEPGVVIKFYSSYAYAGLNVKGAIKAEGTEKDKIIFTSFYDDQYGGDLNGDGTSTSPSIGNWRGIHILSSSTGSVFNNAVFRYGGGYFLGDSGYEKANLFVKDVDIDISNSSFGSSTTYGLYLFNSDSRITVGNFENNAVGFYSVLGKPAISSSVFSGNKQGLVLNGSSAEVKNNRFESNTDFAFEAVGNQTEISGNSGSNNGYNGILLRGDLTQANASSTLKPNSDFPYILGGHVNVVASSTLTIEPGVVIKMKDDSWLNVLGGKLAAQGVNPSDIIFTSIKDNSVGGYTKNSTSTVPKAGDWYAIKAVSGADVDFQGVTVKYGGKFRIIYPHTTVELENSIGNFNNVIFDSNNSYGLYLRNSTTTIKNSEFKNHLTGYGQAITYLDSPIDLQNVKFSNNLVGVMANANSLVQTAQVIWENNVATTSPPNLFK